MILKQQTSLLETFADNEQIHPTGIQLYKDFLMFIQGSNDQIKTYEFIEKMRLVFSPDEMGKIIELHLQVKQNENEYGILLKKKAALKEWLMELGREKEKLFCMYLFFLCPNQFPLQ